MLFKNSASFRRLKCFSSEMSGFNEGEAFNQAEGFLMPFD